MYLHSKIYNELIKQEIYAIAIIKIEAYGKVYGYLRAEALALDTGRIWQHLEDRKSVV